MEVMSGYGYALASAGRWVGGPEGAAGFGKFGREGAGWSLSTLKRSAELDGARIGIVFPRWVCMRCAGEKDVACL